MGVKTWSYKTPEMIEDYGDSQYHTAYERQFYVCNKCFVRSRKDQGLKNVGFVAGFLGFSFKGFYKGRSEDLDNSLFEKIRN